MGSQVTEAEVLSFKTKVECKYYRVLSAYPMLFPHYEDREDFKQQLWLVVVEACGTYRGTTASLNTWVEYKIDWYIKDCLRKQRRAREVTFLPLPVDTPARVVVTDADLRLGLRIFNGVANVSARDMAVVQLTTLLQAEGFHGVKIVAKRYGMSRNAVAQVCYQVRQKLLRYYGLERRKYATKSNAYREVIEPDRQSCNPEQSCSATAGFSAGRDKERSVQ